MARLTSTGRKPTLDLAGIENLLSTYFGKDQPSVEALSEKLGLTPATVRKYLKLALGSLPRGRAACMPRDPKSVKALVNGIPTEALIGAGRVQLLLRHREAGASLSALAEEFGISRDRVTKLVRSVEGEPEPKVSAAPEAVEPEVEVACASEDEASAASDA